MKRKSLFGLAMLLFLSTVAFSNERSRFHCRASGDLPCPNACSHKAPAAGQAASTSGQAASEEASSDLSTHVLLHTFVKLLYI